MEGWGGAYARISPLLTSLVLSCLSHAQLSGELKTITNEKKLTDVGELEQDLVFNERTSKDLLAFLEGEGPSYSL